MKNLQCVLTFITILFINFHTFAQAPQKFNYQAVCRDNTGAIISNQSVNFRLSIHDLTPSGSIVYQEIHITSTNFLGLVNLEIGSGSAQIGSFNTILWNIGDKYIETEIDYGSGYISISITQLISVPYALHSKTAETITGGFNHYIGELYGGGIIVALWKEAGVEKGLIASLADLSTGSTWSNISSTSVGSAARSLFDGQTNTNAIISQPGHTSSAAKICYDYVYDGFSDWYLPSAWELNQCYNSAFVVNTIIGASNGFKSASYWSSTEAGNDSACPLNFFTGSPNSSGLKLFVNYVRAVRRF